MISRTLGLYNASTWRSKETVFISVITAHNNHTKKVHLLKPLCIRWVTIEASFNVFERLGEWSILEKQILEFHLWETYFLKKSSFITLNNLSSCVHKEQFLKFVKNVWSSVVFSAINLQYLTSAICTIDVILAWTKGTSVSTYKVLTYWSHNSQHMQEVHFGENIAFYEQFWTLCYQVKPYKFLGLFAQVILKICWKPQCKCKIGLIPKNQQVWLSLP